ncbi:uncharacterized protein LOC129576533 [Sitodiplosis mosellana]|uniref:uncharacterized protein LOC129576533 n=1 Tax=Sitodiplosis mosellana TaxID=263140 RepID=UPI002444338A|nr:uncharacterized protein LOC129576533 [Sitodiplosis mosellana]
MDAGSLPTFPNANSAHQLNQQQLQQQQAPSDISKISNGLERLKKRMGNYRQHHTECGPRFDQSFTGACEQQSIETVTLQKRFLENKAKKAAKKADKKQPENASLAGNLQSSVHVKMAGRPNHENSPFSGNTHRSLMLMKDMCGNYMVQKIFDTGTESQRHELRQVIQANFMMLSMHKYACRVVQVAIEKSPVHQQIFMIQSVFPDDIVELAKNVNGNHVMQQLFRCVPLNVQDYLFDRVRNQIIELCLDSYGCHVVQCIFANGSPNHRSGIFNAITGNEYVLLELIQHPYGNYVVQHAIRK